MKKFIIILLLIISALTVNAQNTSYYLNKFKLAEIKIDNYQLSLHNSYDFYYQDYQEAFVYFFLYNKSLYLSTNLTYSDIYYMPKGIITNNSFTNTITCRSIISKSIDVKTGIGYLWIANFNGIFFKIKLTFIL
jgi:hypothetical protein